MPVSMRVKAIGRTQNRACSHQDFPAPILLRYSARLASDSASVIRLCHAIAPGEESPPLCLIHSRIEAFEGMPPFGMKNTPPASLALPPALRPAG
jgi:hypothetical protein